MWNPKDPNDIVDYAVDWTDLLAGDTIATLDAVDITPVESPGLTEYGSPSRFVTATVTTVWLTGGTAGQTYTIDFTITTVGGRVYQRAQTLLVQETLPATPWPIVVTLPQAKTHLRITSTAHDPDIALKLAQAHALVLDYISQRRSDAAAWAATIAAWTPATVPSQVQAGILIQLTELWEFRGDADARVDDGALSPQTRAYLGRLRDPAVA